MLKTRIITAVVLLIGFSADLFLASQDVFALVLAFMVAAAAWEWSRLSGVISENLQTAYACVLGLLVLISLYIPYGEGPMRWLLLFSFIFWASIPALFYLAPRQQRITTCHSGQLVWGVFVLVMSAVSMQYLRSYAQGGSSFLLLYALSIIWVMDIGAYFSGKRFGKNKLAPAISPGKTWEGVYGGLVATTILFLIVLMSADFASGNGLKLLVATIFAAVASVLGDLYESRIKRAADMKDSSQLLPGHGGVLDRVDGVISAIPVFAFFWAWL